jgi:hypothetical protein
VTVESFPLGTVITVSLNPLRNGKTFGAMAQGAPLDSLRQQRFCRRVHRRERRSIPRVAQLIRSARR